MSLHITRLRQIAQLPLYLGLLFSVSFAVAQGPAPAEASDLSIGKVRQALTEERAQIAAHPKAPEPYVQLAYTLCDAGMGEEARLAVSNATRIAPRSAFALSAQAWILRHNAIGVDFGKGFDYDGSLQSYQKAIELDPRDLDIRESLGNLLDHNREGIEYGPGAQLSSAIDAYRYAKNHQSPVQAQTEDNLGLTLFYAGRYQEVLDELKHPGNTAKHQGLILASVAALQGSEASIALSRSIGGDEQARKDALNAAAEGLWDVQLYAQASDLMTASLPDTAEGNAISGRIQLFSGLKPLKVIPYSSSDPRRPVQQLVVAMIQNSLNDAVVKEAVSRSSFATETTWRRDLKEQDQLAGLYSTLTRQTGLPKKVIADLLFSRINFIAAPGTGAGTSVFIQGLGSKRISFFVLPEDGVFKIVATGLSASPVGAQALALLDQQRFTEAASLLDWRRSLEQPATIEDPLGGSPFSRLWTIGKPHNEPAMKLAAASLVQDPVLLRPLVPTIVVAREGATSDETKVNLDLLLAHTYLQLKDIKNSVEVTNHLLVHFPNSLTAIQLSGKADELSGNWTGWRAILTPQLKAHPGDRGLLLESASEAETEGNFSGARSAYHTLLESGHATPADYNMDAWLSLFENKVDDQAIAEAQQANMAEKNESYAFLQTLACLNATRGRTAEAHQELLDAMNSGHLDEPNSAIWLGFGLIDEQYGEKAAAIAAYRRVTPSPETTPASLEHTNISSYAFAQLRLKALGST